MSVTKEQVLEALKAVSLPGGDPVTRDLVRALAAESGVVRFILEGAPESELTAMRPAP